MSSTIGRPRALTDSEVMEILAWHHTRRTVADVAREYRVSVSTIHAIIRRKGRYKLPSPEERYRLLAERAVRHHRRRAHYLMG